MRKFLVTLIVIATACSIAVADNSSGPRGFGPRIGYASDPNQFHFGGQLEAGEITSNLILVPNLEIGVGNEVTTTAPTVDVDYRFNSTNGDWAPYLGGGLGIVFRSPESGVNESNLGLYLQGGVIQRSSGNSGGRFFMELRLGLTDVPGAAVTAGWFFGR